MIYTNTKNFQSQQIEFLPDGLKITKKSPVDFHEYEIAFEQISNKKIIRSTISDGMLLSGICFIIFGFLLFLVSDSFATSLLMGIGLLLVLITFLRRIRVVIIPTFTEEVIKLHYTPKNKADVVHLANEIIAASNSFLLQKYSKIDPSLPIEPQVENLQFLRNRNILNEEQYENLKDRLLGREHKSAIGFK